MPESFADLMKQGGDAYERGDLETARVHFEQALALDPGATVARYRVSSPSAILGLIAAMADHS